LRLRPKVRTNAAMVLALILAAASYCGETPTRAPSHSVGRANRGSLEGGVPITESATLRVLPRRHKARCLNYGTGRLVHALEHAAAKVGGPPLGVGDIARARGGSIAPLSRSHQSGRDADLAFYAVKGALDDLEKLAPAELDVKRQWQLVAALLEDPSIQVKWMFVSDEIRGALLAEGARVKAAPATLARATAVLHQPSDAPPHDDHLHLRIACTAEEQAAGCR